jgi:hypothetical protein
VAYYLNQAVQFRANVLKTTRQLVALLPKPGRPIPSQCSQVNLETSKLPLVPIMPEGTGLNSRVARSHHGITLERSSAVHDDNDDVSKGALCKPTQNSHLSGGSNYLSGSHPLK